MLGVNVFAAESEAEARRLFTSLQQAFIYLRRGRPGRLQDPADIDTSVWTPEGTAPPSATLPTTPSSDSPSPCAPDSGAGSELTAVDELMVTAHVFDHEARKRSFTILSGVRATMTAA